MNKYIAEFIGTFFLLFSIGVSVVLAPAQAPFAIAATLTGVIYMGGHVSKAHYNPAVTIAFWMRGRHEKKEILPYLAAEFLGALLGAALAWAVTGETIAVEPAEGMALWRVALVEVLYTFALVSVILNVATSKDHPGNGFYGIAIGLIVLGGILTVGSVSGAAFNPSVVIGLNALKGSWSLVPLYLVADFAGGALAAVGFRWMNPDDR